MSSLGDHGAAPRDAQITGEIWLGGEQLVGADPERVRSLRGRRMAMIFQDPLSALHPYYTVGAQIVEAYRLHHPEASKKAARAHAVDLLGRVGIPQPSSRVDDYPHKFSGGMRQRAMIAMALANDPELLIADEPTTALDVTVQAQILDLILDLQAEFDSAVMLITHDLGVVAEVADDILVMYAGRGVEYGPATEVFTAPAHPYTWGLLESVPRFDRDGRAGSCRSPAARRACSPRRRGARSTPAAATASSPGAAPRPSAPSCTTSGRGHRVACHLHDAERRRILDEEVAAWL